MVVFSFFFFPQSGFADVIGPGDVLKVEVFGEKDLSGNFSVSETGTIKINWVEPIGVAGKTVEEAQEAIRSFLDQKYIINPKVGLSIAEYKSQTVSLMGEIVKPGLYRIKEESTLLSILLEAGGPTNRASDEIVVLRSKAPGGKEYDSSSTSLQKLLTEASPEVNRPLKTGDIIYVASPGDSKGKETTHQVYVLGAVKNSGSYSHRKGYTALDAVIDAGGVTKFASPNGTKIFRGKADQRKTIPVRLGDVLTKGNRSKNVLLEPGDLLIVPQRFL